MMLPPGVMESLDGSYLGRGPVSNRTLHMCCRVVERSGLQQLYEEFRKHDRQLGGRRLVLSPDTTVTLMFLNIFEGGPAHMTDVADLILNRLTADQRATLGIPPRTPFETKKQWIDRLHASFDALTILIDPKWMPNRRKRCTKVEFEAIKASRDPTDVEQKTDRLYHLANALIRATIDLLPRKHRENFRGDRACDGTSYKVFPWGTARDSDVVSIEPNAWFYRRDGNHRVANHLNADGRKKGKVERFFGYELTLFVWVKHMTDDPRRYPGVVDGMGFNPPGWEPADVTVRAARTIHKAGLPIGVLRTDGQYWAGQQVDKFHRKMWEMDFEAWTDLREDQYGLSRTESASGAIVVEGEHYCPLMLRSLELIEGTRKHHVRDESVRKPALIAIADERATYRLTDKVPSQPGGKRVVVCPAVRGDIDCILKRGKVPPARIDALPSPPDTKSAGPICDNTWSTTLPSEERPKLSQRYPFGTPNWWGCKGQRNPAESFNAALKDTTISKPGSFRLHGFAAHFLLSALCVMTANIKRINDFLAGCSHQLTDRSKAEVVVEADCEPDVLDTQAKAGAHDSNRPSNNKRPPPAAE